MVKAIDLIGSNAQMQQHWIRRFVAAIIDGIIMSVIWIVISIVLGIIGVSVHWTIIPFFTGSFWLLYSAFLEGTSGATIGKRLMNLLVVSTEGAMDLGKAFIRNVSKIYGLIFLIDWLVGFVTDGDPRQRYLDRIANTTVVRTDAQEIFLGAYQPPAGPMPRPYGPQQPAPQYQQPQYPAQQPAQQPYGQPTPQPQPAPAAPQEAPSAPQEKAEPTTEKEVGYTREELVNLKKDELIKMVKDRGLKVSGTKRDLIDRILGEEVEGD